MTKDLFSPNLGVKYRGGILVNDDLCVGCKQCYEICPLDIFAFDPETKRPIVAYPQDCWYCGACIYECPVDGTLRMELPLACL
jgi:NAD-dependent dihydropyrimidine dehydrogenase PreA subunit